MNKAYIFLLKKRYGHGWKNLKEKLKYYFDFSMIYLVLLLYFFFLFYREMWMNPHLILQSIASFFTIIPSNFWFSMALLIFIQSAIKGLTAPPIHYNIGDTYFLFTLPIPKRQYIFFEWLLVQGKSLLIILLCFFLSGPIFHLLWTEWFINAAKLLLQIVMLSICLINVQWLSFQLPLQTKKLFLRILRYIKIASFIVLGVVVIFLGWVIIFSNNILHNLNFTPQMIPTYTFDINYTLILVLYFFISSALSIYFINRASLEALKDSSIHQDKIKTLRTLGMMKEATNILKGKDKKEKRYFLSIPGFYKSSKIFLWRNLSQLIKQPGQYLFSYGIYVALGIGVMTSTKGEPISLVFIFFALYILGQSMLSPLQEQYGANYFLSSFPVQSIKILKGYLLLPVILSTIMGMIFSGFMGWLLKDLWVSLILILNLPFFSYFTLLAAMKNVLEDMNLALTVNKTLHMEALLLVQGAVPIIFGIIFLKEGIAFGIIGSCTAIGYLLMAKISEKDVIKSLQQVLHKYS